MCFILFSDINVVLQAIHIVFFTKSDLRNIYLNFGILYSALICSNCILQSQINIFVNLALSITASFTITSLDYSKTCLKGPLTHNTKNWFSTPIIT